MTTEELVNMIQDDLTISKTLPKVLPDIEVKRLIDHTQKLFEQEYKNYLVKGGEANIFDKILFIEYVLGTCKMRMGEAIGRFNFNLPGNFQWNAEEIIQEGKEMRDKVELRLDKYDK
jgi:hypothetical protein